MAGLLDQVNEWLARGLVLLSLAAHLLLPFLAEVRRREASGWGRSILWVALQVADWAATNSIANLFLGSTSTEQQLVAFWLPFLLIHLGRPDNISAYSLDDNKLSQRQLLQAVMKVVQATYALYKHISGASSAIIAASVIMFPVGVVKYGERVLALWQADLSIIQSSGKKYQHHKLGRSFPRAGLIDRDDEEALLVAHRLINITKGAFADYSPLEQEGPLRWPYGLEEATKLVEMELSIMYDILYTKAAVIHTSFGYAIRAASPLLTAAAFAMFWSFSKAGQREADVLITYVLLAVTFLLDMRWLLRALGSAWTYAFFLEGWPSRLHHTVLCTGRWRRLRRLVTSLDPCWFVLGKEPTAYRMWSGSGKIGQINMFHECVHEASCPWKTLLGMAKIIGLKKDSRGELFYHYSRGIRLSPCVRRKLLQGVWKKLELAYGPQPKPPPPSAQPAPPDEDKRRRTKLDKALNFDPEFQEEILVLHIATNVFLFCSGENASPSTCVKTIKVLSDYMVFLVSVRPTVLPGLKLSSLYKTTRNALQDIWRKYGYKKRHNPGSTGREEKLANILQEMEKNSKKKKEKKRNGENKSSRPQCYSVRWNSMCRAASSNATK